jgi:hypothetical protein
MLLWWFSKNAKEMAKNHPTQYHQFVNLVNKLYSHAEKLDKLHDEVQ